MTRKLSTFFATFSAFLLLVLMGVAHERPLHAAQQTTAQPPQQAAQKDAQRGPLEYNETDIAAKKWPTEAVRAPKAMVVSDNPLADQAGIEILQKGGNAVDAAVAVAFALAVVEPRAGNIGGGGFMLVRLADGRSSFIDYREEAPKSASRELYRKPDGTYDMQGSRLGYRAVGVPGTVAGMALALKTYGKLKLADVMAPAIRLADGFTISDKLAKSLTDSQKRLTQFDRSKHIFLNDGKLYQPGETLKQPELAATLRRIAKKGADEFYKGQTARDLAREMKEKDGLITMADLAAYRAKLREPLSATYESKGAKWEVITSPPPSSGGIAMIEALNILDPIELKGWQDAESVHMVAEAMRRVFADRATFLGDSDFVHVPVKGLTDPKYAAARRASIDPNRSSSSQFIGAGNPAPFDGNIPANAAPATIPQSLTREQAESISLREAQREGHTTHFSVVDAAGNAVSNTYTINDSYGAGVTAPGGFLLNDEMDDFTAQPGQANMFGLVQSEGNTIAPGKRPLSSMMPTIVLRDGKLSFVTGSPGGPQIISATMLTVINWMRFGPANPEGAMLAIDAPRFHHQWMPDNVLLEQDFPLEVMQQLEAMGHKVTRKGWIGEVNAIGIDPRTGERLGAGDPRRQGAAQGY
ncbi:MAG TPA: gamma-glutamyltransferase [Candidatus Limnocylindrales bacterium]|nr:gamma-glutamyltransferase [Candidatus Limnocylindrales bacterium]